MVVSLKLMNLFAEKKKDVRSPLLTVKVTLFAVGHQPLNGSLHRLVLKFIKTGSIHLLPLHVQIAFWVVVDGLYQICRNYKIRDILVELIGTSPPEHTTVLQTAAATLPSV